jgi:hypothetical protein
LIALAAVQGCGSGSPIGLVAVSGTVTYNGQALNKGTITFMPTSGTNSSTGEIVDGKYSLSTFKKGDGVPPGQYQVAIASWETEPTMDTPGVRAIPEKYFDAKQSGLTATVGDKSSQTVDFTVTAE